MSMVDDDIDAAIAAMPDAVTVVFGTTSAKGLIDVVDADALKLQGIDATGTVRALVIRTGSLGELVRGAQLTVDGTAYKFHHGYRQGDGREYVCHLTEA